LILLKLALAPLFLIPLAFSQSINLPAKETLSYNVEWRLITAGKVKVDWQQERSGWRVDLHVESAGLVSKLFKVADDYSATMTEALCVQSTQLTSNEGSRARETRINFDYAAKKANYVERDRTKNAVLLTKEIDIPACIHDVAGGLYFIRTLNLEPGQSTTAAVSDGKKAVNVKVEAQQREDVRTPAGTFKAIRYEVYLFNDVLFHRYGHLYVWLTDDRRKLPVQIRTRLQFAIGTITLQLEKHE
jgi:hypothetical protein